MPEGRQKLSDVACNPVERARACISLLSFVSESAARDVHVLSLRRAYLRLGSAGELRFGIGVLNFLGEVQDLGHGYQFPAPSRAVPIGELAVVLSPSPTWELCRHFASVVEGYGRSAKSREVEHLDKQQLSDWLGVAGEVRIDLDLRTLIKEGHAGMRPASPDQKVEYLYSGVHRGESRLSWTGDSARALKLGGLMLCRRRISETYFQYFLGEVSAHGLAGESVELRDPEYSQFLFAYGAGSPVTVQKTVHGDLATLRFPVPPPRAERKLLLALARRTRRKDGVAFTLRKALLPVVEQQMTRLGIRLGSA
jgi:hypothetical protein